MRIKEIQKGTVSNIRCDILVCLFLVLTTLAVYWQVGLYPFVNYDDTLYVTENYHVINGLTVDGITWAFTDTHTGNWHPVTMISHMLDCQLYGLDSGQHHMTSLLFHILNTLLLFYVFFKMSENLWQSGFVAVMFALHPLHVESVVWIAERKDVLSTFFWMLTMASYVRYIRNPCFSRYCPVLLFFILGLMSKSMLVTLPIVLLLLDFWPLGRLRTTPEHITTLKSVHPVPSLYPLIQEKIPLFGIAAVFCFITVFAQKSAGAVGTLELFSLGSRIANALVSYAGYMGKMFRPIHLAVFYPHPAAIPIWKIAGAAVLLTGITIWAIRGRTVYPYFITGWLWYLVTLLPVIGLVQVGLQSMADRYTYIPLIGLFIIIAWGTPDFVAGWRHKKRALGVISTLLLLILMTTSWLQVKYWGNTISLFEHAIEVTEDNYFAHLGLGNELTNQGKLNAAVEQYNKALMIRPEFATAHFHLANVRVRQEKFREAIHHYMEAIRIKPDFAEAYNYLGYVLAKQGKINEAINHYQKALYIKPDYAPAHFNLGIIMMYKGNVEAAASCFSEVLRIRPDYHEVRKNLINLQAIIEKRNKARLLDRKTRNNTDQKDSGNVSPRTSHN